MDDWISDDIKACVDAMESARKRQWYYLKIADPKIKAWSESQRCKIYRIDYIPHFGESLEVLVFYLTESKLKKYRKRQKTDQTRKAIVSILEEIGYVSEFNDDIKIGFDSDENVQKNHQGNYGYVLHDGTDGTDP